MPYEIKKQGNKYAIVNKQTGKTVGHSASKSDAQKSINAAMAAEHNKKK